MYIRMGDIDRMFGTMDLLQKKMDRLFSGMDPFLGHAPGWPVEHTAPHTSLYEDGDHFEIRAKVPGLTKDDLNVKIQGNYLELSGKRKVDTPEGYAVHRTERGSNTFSRSFTLPADIDSTKAEATLKNGVLYLTLPKAETAKTRQITIR